MKAASSNYQKHTSHNSLQRWLIGRFYSDAFALLSQASVRTILDAGCGEGFTLHRIAEKWPQQYALEGIDSSAAAIKTGKSLYPGLTLVQGSIYSLPHPDSSFDIVICTEVLEHLTNPQAALAQIRRVTKQYVLLSVPREPLFRLANFLRGKNLSRWGNDIEHIQHWSSSAFVQFVRQNGLEVVHMRQPFPWTMLLCRKRLSA